MVLDSKLRFWCRNCNRGIYIIASFVIGDDGLGFRRYFEWLLTRDLPCGQQQKYFIHIVRNGFLNKIILKYIRIIFYVRSNLFRINKQRKSGIEMVVLSNKKRESDVYSLQSRHFFHTFDTRLITSLLNFSEKKKAKTTPNIYFLQSFFVFIGTILRSHQN